MWPEIDSCSNIRNSGLYKGPKWCHDAPKKTPMHSLTGTNAYTPLITIIIKGESPRAIE